MVTDKFFLENIDKPKVIKFYVLLDCRDVFEEMYWIHPRKQREVRKIIELAKEMNFNGSITVFGSSVTHSHYFGSDLDLFIRSGSRDSDGKCYDKEWRIKEDISTLMKNIRKAVNCECDFLLTEDIEDNKKLSDSINKGVIIYEHAI